MTQSLTISGTSISLDLLLWRRYGDAGQALLVAAYGLNPGLAALGPILPAGTVVTLPDAPATTSAPVVAAPVDLFA